MTSLHGPGAPGAFLALWNGIASTDVQPEYETWHSVEHVPERVGLPGFIEARRYRSPGPAAPAYFTCYWVDSLAAFSTPAYTGIFASPTPWTARMRGELRDFFRLTCTLGGAFGVASASQLATLHFTGDAAGFAPAVTAELGARVNAADLISAQWGRAEATAAIPIANSAAPTAAAGTHDGARTSFVVMLQHLDPIALQAQAAALTRALAPVALPASPPAFFELLTQVRRQDLPPTAPGERQPARGDLLRRFEATRPG